MAADQRGGPRLLGLHVDIGAAELNYAAVSNTQDSGAGSLRAAVARAPAVVEFAGGLLGQTITLTNGQITLATNVTIDASDLAGGVTISGNTNSRLFEVSSSASVILGALTLANGSESGGSGGGIIVDMGATLTVTNCTLTNNSAALGGGMENQGNPGHSNNSTFSMNSGDNGGAIH